MKKKKCERSITPGVNLRPPLLVTLIPTLTLCVKQSLWLLNLVERTD